LETLNIDKLITRLSIFDRSLIESLNIGELIDRLTLFYRDLLETLNINEFITRIQNFVKLISETLNITDFISRLAMSFRWVSEPFSILIRLLKTLFTAAPTITIHYPEENEYYFEEESILLNATATTTGNRTIDTWWFNVGNASGNITFTPPTNMSLTEKASRYTVIVSANNSIGRVGSDSVSFFVISKHNAYFWLYLCVFMLVCFFMIIGYTSDDHTFGLFAGMLMCMFGLSLALEGFPFFDNPFLEKGLWLTILGVGFFLTGASGLRLIKGGRE